MIEAASADHPDEIKKEILKWNWGAFFLGWIWALGNKLWAWVLIGLAVNAISLIPSQNDKPVLISLICQTVISVILGVKGNEWAWKRQKWENLQHFKRIQGRWLRWGLVFSVVGFIVGFYIGSQSM